MSAIGTHSPLPEGGRRWLGREWIDEAKALQRGGLTFSEIADQLNLNRDAVVKALYWEEVAK